MERTEQIKRSASDWYEGDGCNGPRKYRGVFTAGKKFRAVMQLDGVRHNLGMYKTEVEAAHAYDAFARNNCKKTNFPCPPGQVNVDNQIPSVIDNHNARVIDRFDNRTRMQTNLPKRQKFPSYSWPGPHVSTSSAFTASMPYTSDWVDDRSNQGSYIPFPQAPGYSDKTYQSQDQFEWSPGQLPPLDPHRPHHLQRDWQQQSWVHDPHIQHSLEMYQLQRRNDPHLMQSNPVHPHMPYNPHLAVVYVPIPVAIVDTVKRYVNDFLLSEQQHILEESLQEEDQPTLEEEVQQFPSLALHRDTLPEPASRLTSEGHLLQRKQFLSQSTDDVHSKPLSSISHSEPTDVLVSRNMEEQLPHTSNTAGNSNN